MKAFSALILGVLLAGCATPPAATDPSAPGSGSPGATLAGGPVLRVANFTVATPHFDGWFNGSLAANDYRLCLVVTCTPGGKDTDLTPMLAKGAWARINATLTWSDAAEEASWDAIGGHVLFLGFSTGDDDVVRWEETHSVDRMGVEIVLQHTGDEPVVASVLRNFQGSGAANDYVLHIEVSPLTFDPEAPMALHADASATTLVAHTALGGGTLRVWDGADRFVGAVPLKAPATRIDLRNLTKGEPVLQVVDAPADLRLEVAQAAAAPAPTLRPLSIAWKFGPPQDVASQGALDWQFEVARVPLWIGMYLQAKGNDSTNCVSTSSAGACYATFMGTGTLRSPAGTLVDLSWNCYLCGGPGWVASDPGDAALVPGTYSGHYEDAAAANLQVGEVEGTYVR